MTKHILPHLIDPVVPKVTMYGGAAASGGGATWAWMGENYQQIGALMAIIGAVFAIIGWASTHRSNQRREKQQVKYHKDMLDIQRAKIAKFQEGKAKVIVMSTAALMAALFQTASYVSGKEGVSLAAYLDPGAIPTICFGHTKGVSLGDTLLPEECATLLIEDVRQAQSEILRVVKVPLNINQLTALTSLNYNVGLAEIQKSRMLKNFNAGNYEMGCIEIAIGWDTVPNPVPWAEPKKIVLKGLTTRRLEERELCLAPL